MDEGTQKPTSSFPKRMLWDRVRRLGHILSARLHKPLAVFIIFLIAVFFWEGYKLLGSITGNQIPFTDVPLPIRTDNTSMPHLWSIIIALFRPAQRGGGDMLIILLLRSAMFTWRVALAGFVFGALLGFLIAIIFVHAELIERGFMPYVVASQTIPLLAIAPMVVIWGSRLHWPPWISVALITATLTFFPVTINSLRGLRSPDANMIELMRSYAASNSQILWKLRLPASIPYIFAALKIAATASIIGAIIGELPSGIPNGLGRALLNFSYFYITGPEKLYAAIIITALLGIIFVFFINLIERLLMANQRPLDID